MTVQSREATITIECTDRELIRAMVFRSVRAVLSRYQETYVLHSLTIYHDRDKPYTARLTWQTDPDRTKAGT